MVLVLFGVQWVMPRRVIDLLGVSHQNIVIWRAIPHCFMWCLWKERNARTFEGCEQSIAAMKLQFFR